MRHMALALTASIALLALPAAAQTTWVLPSAYPTNNFHTENLQWFADDVAKATDGKLTIELHPSASRSKPAEIKQAVRGGQVQAGEILLVDNENEDPLYGLDGVPFLATSYAEAWDLYKVSRRPLANKLAKQGMLLLYTVPSPPQGIFTNRTLNSVADMRGLKWRVDGPTAARFAGMVGAQPVTVPSVDVSQALATGAIDACMASGATGYDSKIYEHLGKFYDTQAWIPKSAVIANRKAFNALPRAERAAVLKAAAAAETRGWKLSEKDTHRDYEQLRRKGMNILKPPPTLTAGLHKVGNELLAAWLKRAGHEGRQIISAYRALQ